MEELGHNKQESPEEDISWVQRAAAVLTATEGLSYWAGSSLGVSRRSPVLPVPAGDETETCTYSKQPPAQAG